MKKILTIIALLATSVMAADFTHYTLQQKANYVCKIDSELDIVNRKINRLSPRQQYWANVTLDDSTTDIIHWNNDQTFKFLTSYDGRDVYVSTKDSTHHLEVDMGTQSENGSIIIPIYIKAIQNGTVVYAQLGNCANIARK
jgi:hypothetical protein